MDVTLPNGRVIKGVPDGTPKDVIMQKAIAGGLASEEDFNITAPTDAPVAQQGEYYGEPIVNDHGQFQVGTPGDKIRGYRARLADYVQGGAMGNEYQPKDVFLKSADITSDVAATLGSGMAAEPVAGWAGIAAAGARDSIPADISRLLGYDPNKYIPSPEDAVARTREALTLKPRTEAGSEALGSIADTLEPVGTALAAGRAYLGDGAYNLTGSPTAAAAAATIPDALLLGSGGFIGRLGSKTNAGRKASATNKGIEKQIQEAAPSQETLKSTASALYKEIDDAGVTVKSQPFETWRARLNAIMKKEGMYPGTTDKSVSAMAAINSVDPSNLPMTELLQLRKVASNAASTLDKADKRLAVMIIDEIDVFIDHATVGTVNSPKISPAIIGEKLKKARDLYGREARSETLGRALEKASTGGSGLENGIRIEVRKILRNEKTMKYFRNDPETVKALKEIERGTFTGNLFKTMGRAGFYEPGTTHFLGGLAGGATGAAMAAAVGLPPLVGAVIVPLIGQVSKSLALKLTQNNASFADRVLRAGNDAKKITAAYNQFTPIGQRSAAELSELLVNKKISLAGLNKAGLELDAANLAAEKRAMLTGVIASTQTNGQQPQ